MTCVGSASWAILAPPYESVISRALLVVVDQVKEVPRDSNTATGVASDPDPLVVDIRIRTGVGIIVANDVVIVGREGNRTLYRLMSLSVSAGNTREGSDMR